MALLQNSLLVILIAAYLAVFGLALWRWKGQLDRVFLIFAASLTSIWLVSNLVISDPQGSVTVRLFHLLHLFIWVSLLLKLLHAKHRSYNKRIFVIGVIFLAICAALLVGIFGLLYETDVNQLQGHELVTYLFPIIILAMSLAGLYVIWRINKRDGNERRANVRVLCLAVSFVMLYQLLCGMQRLTLGKLLDIDWVMLTALYGVSAVLLLKSSLQRDVRWMGSVYVSRDAVMYGAGAVLAAMAVYSVMLFLRNVDGGGRLDYALAYLLLAVTCSVILIGFFSTRVRAHVHVFLGKHFFNYRYDYREEWLRLIRTLSKGGAGAHMLERVIQSVAQIVGSKGGMLWVNRYGDQYDPVARWGEFTEIEVSEHASSDLVRFLEERQWVIEHNEYMREPELYDGLKLPDWVLNSEDIWLIVPLMQDIRLLGFVAIPPSSIRRSINWEDRDLIKTAGRQAATHIAQLLATQALIEAQEFDAFNRLSAFVVHDLKNVVGQLTLVTKNAEKHRHNPDFIEDTFSTVESASRRGERLLAQLRDRSPRAKVQARIALGQILVEVAKERSGSLPQPSFTSEREVYVIADAKQLKEVINHLVENAQQATDDSGKVGLRLFVENQYAVLEVADTGRGMDAQFVRERLFRPFDSTKGEEGMGIGVYQSREIIRGLRGSIDVDSEPGKGSKFTIRLPIVE